MNRLVTRLLLALLTVSVVSMVIVPIAQSVAARRTLSALAPEFRQRVEERTQPPPLLGSRPPRLRDRLDARPSFDQEEVEEAARLFTLFGNYRAAQRRGILFGLAVAFTLGVLLALWLSRSIARPIEAVSRAAAGLARGDLSTRVALTNIRTQPLETRALAQDFNRMADALETLEGERKAMIADIAHELRNPLATLQLRLDALEDGLVAFDNAEVGVLKGQVGLLSRLIGDLRTLSLADAGRLSIDRTEVDVGALLGRIAETYRSRAEGLGIQLEYEAPDTPFFVEADPDRLTQIVYNLLDNALTVTPEGGWTELSLGANDEHVTLSVKDAGPGIAEEDLSSIFERFVQGRRRDTQQGSGLGLAIVHALVTLHGGTVTAHNHAAGAQFDITLPRVYRTQEGG